MAAGGFRGSRLIAVAASRALRRGAATHPAPPGRNGRGFGIVLDIDGVICRGKQVLPGVREAFLQYLLDDKGAFTVPTVFVTNAGNMTRVDKAQALGEKIGIEIDPEQMIMSHSPLKMFTQFHDQHVLVVGQGPILEIAHALGFKRVTTIDDLRSAFPGYDCVDHKRRVPDPITHADHFGALDAVILFGEPIRWETALQYLVDVLLTNGRLKDPLPSPGPHIPVLACNIDLLFSAETAPMPRFAHGSFLLCLEALYHKMSGGRELRYSALMGKPSELTYHHAEYCIQREASKIALPCPHTIYAIGDNPESDILGANIFQQYLTHRKIQNQHQQAKKAAAEEKLGRWRVSHRLPTMSYDRASIDNSAKYFLDQGVHRCHSVLVETGVYSAKSQMQGVVSNFHLRELAKNTLLKTPSFVEQDLLHAIQMIWEREAYMENLQQSAAASF